MAQDLISVIALKVKQQKQLSAVQSKLYPDSHIRNSAEKYSVLSGVIIHPDEKHHAINHSSQ
ncbi:hypothetical protein KDD30_05585 [Photobacterium sp. GJ3]|uniref:hypothetical protein n=1 Tax=Photobacterium sp. GJ3 TaxID=2829502 RepID=UPI001B8CDD86|nr:hypothetical protein [Photobacterium sp. GJ3]QUJ68585.1 hypothetical protein KDD30_05585 [Photobacterium sp. GJ3]